MKNLNNTTTTTESEAIIEKGFWATTLWAAKLGVRAVGHTLAAGDNVTKSFEIWSTLLPQQAADNVKLANTRRTLTIASKLATIESDHNKLLAKLGIEESLISEDEVNVKAFMQLADEIAPSKKSKKK